MYRSPLVPSDFVPPESLETDRFRLQPLFYDVMLQDYEAVLLGADNLARAFGRDSFDRAAYRLQKEVIEIGWHSGEWDRRKSFAYANMSHDGKTCFGSVYVHPTLKRDYDAHVIMWVIPDTLGESFEAHVYDTVRQWIASDWPFEKVGYPGREMSWTQWRALPEPHARERLSRLYASAGCGTVARCRHDRRR